LDTVLHPASLSARQAATEQRDKATMALGDALHQPWPNRLIAPGRWRMVAGSAIALLLGGWIGLYQMGVPGWVPWAPRTEQLDPPGADKSKAASAPESSSLRESSKPLTRSELILLNAVRASQRAPMSFPGIDDSLLKKPISPGHMDFFVAQGWPEELMELLFIASVKVKPEVHDRIERTATAKCTDTPEEPRTDKI